MNNEHPRFMTVQQTAEFLQISCASVYKRLFEGTLPRTKVGRTVRIDRRILEKQLERNTTVVKY